jgi:hypothetical protein
MASNQDSRLQSAVEVLQTCFEGVAELVQRVVIICADLILIVFATTALYRDWHRHCSEKLHFYGFLCIVLCVVDLLWEFVRCSLESQLDRLQEEFSPEAGSGSGATNENLLGDDLEVIGGNFAEEIERNRGSSVASTSTGALGQGIRKEKAFKQKRTSDIQFWSIVFSCFVSVMFAFFSAHDEECNEHVPHLYTYIHTFTYVFIFRLGCTILWICCRTVKNYEDAANAHGKSARSTQMNVMRF